jgi:hypothetical protein
MENKSVRTFSHCAWKPAKRLGTVSEGLANHWKGLDRIEGGAFTFTDRTLAVSRPRSVTPPTGSCDLKLQICLAGLFVTNRHGFRRAGCVGKD